MKKGVIVVIIGILLLALFAFYYSRKEGGQIACTLEAKLCPDGSYVGRTGPQCEFSPCPHEDTRLWKTVSDEKQGISFKYPDPFPTRFISTHEWPPKVTIHSGGFSCVEGETANKDGLPIQTIRWTVDSTMYCIETSTGAAAGSQYSSYVYKTVLEDRLVSVSFALRYPNCGNYDEPTKNECEREREAFHLDQMVDQIVKTIQFKS